MRVLAVAVLLLTACQPQPQQTQPEGSAMPAFVEDYFNAFFEWTPTYATSLGFHQYDSKLEDHSAAAHSKRIQKLKDLKAQIDAIPRSSMTADEQIDADILQGQINAELLDTE